MLKFLSRERVALFVVLVAFSILSGSLWADPGDQKWVFPADGTVGAVISSPSVGQDGTVYVGSKDRKLYAIWPNGTRRWEFATGGEVTSSPALGYHSGSITIYVGSTNGKVYAIHSDGTKKWEFTAGGSVSSSPAVSHLGTVYAGSEDGKVYAIKSSDGTSEGGEWPFATGEAITSSPAIDIDGTIYIGSADYKVYAIKSTGKKKWEFMTGGVVSASPALYESGDTQIVYVGSEDGKIYALSMVDGAKKWEFNVGSPVLSSPAVDGAALYVGTDNASLYALNLTTGSQIWVFQGANGPFHSSPTIGSDGILYAGSEDFRLYAIKSSNGEGSWVFPTGGTVSSSPTVGFGGVVVVGSQDGRLYAIESSSPRLANVAWPKFGHDVRHTGRDRTNEAPVADAGADQTVNSDDTVTLDGSKSYDPDYGIPLYSWSQTGGTSVALSDTTAVSPHFTAPGVDEETPLTFSLTVTDNGGKTDTDAIIVTVHKKDDDKGCFISTASH